MVHLLECSSGLPSQIPPEAATCSELVLNWQNLSLRPLLEMPPFNPLVIEVDLWQSQWQLINHFKCVVLCLYPFKGTLCKMLEHSSVTQWNKGKNNNKKNIISSQQGRGFNNHLHQAFLCWVSCLCVCLGFGESRFCHHQKQMIYADQLQRLRLTLHLASSIHCTIVYSDNNYVFSLFFSKVSVSPWRSISSQNKI